MEGRTKKIRGLVIPSKWDESGAITAVLIASRDETEYQVEMCSPTSDLIGLLHRMVEVEGEIHSNGSDRPVVKVHRYGPIDTPAPVNGFDGDFCAPK